MKSEMTSCELVVEGEFVTEDTMYEWGWSEQLSWKTMSLLKHQVNMNCRHVSMCAKAKGGGCEDTLQDPARQVDEARTFHSHTALNSYQSLPGRTPTRTRRCTTSRDL